MAVIDSVEKTLCAKWQWSDIDAPTIFLSSKIERNPESLGIKLNRFGYIQGLLKRFGMKGANNVATPIENSVKASRTTRKVERGTAYSDSQCTSKHRLTS